MVRIARVGAVERVPRKSHGCSELTPASKRLSSNTLVSEHFQASRTLPPHSLRDSPTTGAHRDHDMSFFRSANDSDSESESEEELLSDSSDDDGSQPGGLRATKAKKPKGSDDSESDDSDDEDADDKPAAPKKGPSRFLRGGDSDSDDSEDERGRIVRSAKSKKAEEVEQSSKRVENAVKIDDWSTVNSGKHACAPMTVMPS